VCRCGSCLLIKSITVSINGSGRVTQDKITSLFGMGANATLEVVLDPTPRNKFWKVKDANKNIVKLPIYTADDDISGTVTVKLDNNKKFEHLGIRVELIGHLGTPSMRLRNIHRQDALHGLYGDGQGAGACRNTHRQ
jgi:hypothetical protein